MWCPEGFVSLAEIAEGFFLISDRYLLSSFRSEGEPISTDPARPRFFIDTGPPPDEAEALSNWLMARFLEQFASEIRVATPTGALLRLAASLFFVETDDPFDYNDYRTFPEGREARLRAGSVRPLWIRFEGMRITDDLSPGFDQVFRPIANFPLCIAEAAIPKNIEALADKVIEQCRIDARELAEFKEGNPYRLLVQRIVEAWDSWEIASKGEAKARFGRGRKTDEWRALWAEVATHRPEASKSGPRPRPKG